MEKLKQTVKKQFDRTVPNTNTKPILAAACMHSSTWCSLFSNTFFFSFHLFGLLLFLSGFFFLLIHRCVSECACVCVSEVFFRVLFLLCLVRQRFLTSLLVRLVRFSRHVCKLLLPLLLLLLLLLFFFLHWPLLVCCCCFFSLYNFIFEN